MTDRCSLRQSRGGKSATERAAEISPLLLFPSPLPQTTSRSRFAISFLASLTLSVARRLASKQEGRRERYLMREKRSNERGRASGRDNGRRRSVSQVCRLAISPVVFGALTRYCVIFDRHLVFVCTWEVTSSMRGGQRDTFGWLSCLAGGAVVKVSFSVISACHAISV